MKQTWSVPQFVPLSSQPPMSVQIGTPALQPVTHPVWHGFCGTHVCQRWHAALPSGVLAAVAAALAVASSAGAAPPQPASARSTAARDDANTNRTRPHGEDRLMVSPLSNAAMSGSSIV
jgi:hypothetical protein